MTPTKQSRELLAHLFRHPYAKTKAIQSDLSVSRLTTSHYRAELAEAGLLVKKRFGEVQMLY